MNNIYYVLLFILSIFLASFSQILLKIGSNKKNIYINKNTLIGYTFMFIATLFTLIGYKEVDLMAGGILQILSFVFVPVLSLLILKEKIKLKYLIGIFIMLLGMLIYSI